MKPHGTVLFHARFGSGRSSRDWVTRVAGASNCLLVTVTESELLVRPWFPFNLFFLPEIYDLEHRIPKSSISTITERTGMLGAELVDIDFVKAARKKRRLTLRLTEKKDFLKALREGCQPAGLEQGSGSSRT